MRRLELMCPQSIIKLRKGAAFKSTLFQPLKSHPNSNFQDLVLTKVASFFFLLQFEYLPQNYFFLTSLPLGTFSCSPQTITQNIPDT